MADTTIFNIGGTTYQVSRSLLVLHPDSMLTKSASEQWQEDTEVEIFIERNGHRFQYVLDYMRDGKVVLPLTESKESVVMELGYYGVEVDESEVSDTLAKQTICLKSHGDAAHDLYLNSACSKYALDVYTTYTSKMVQNQRVNSIVLDSKDQTRNAMALRSFGGVAMEKVNCLLRPVGLQVSDMGRFVSGGWEVAVQPFDPSDTARKTKRHRR
eukprot:scaffold113119_cov55-Attheya_sp.AAC.3